MIRVTEGPFFSEVAVYYQHVQEVVQLHNLPGEVLWGPPVVCRGLGGTGGTGVCGIQKGPSFLPSWVCLVSGVDGLSLEISCLVDIRDHVNKELALRFSTDIESKGAFFTDLNGFQVGGLEGRWKEAKPYGLH